MAIFGIFYNFGNFWQFIAFLWQFIAIFWQLIAIFVNLMHFRTWFNLIVATCQLWPPGPRSEKLPAAFFFFTKWQFLQLWQFFCNLLHFFGNLMPFFLYLVSYKQINIFSKIIWTIFLVLMTNFIFSVKKIPICLFDQITRCP